MYDPREAEELSIQLRVQIGKGTVISLANSEKYGQTMRDLRVLINAAYRMCENLSDRSFEDRQQQIGHIAFSNTVIHAQAVYQLVPKGPYQDQVPPKEFWHISSIAVLTRTILDSYYTMFYVAVDKVSDELQEFRWLLWDYHSKSRRIRKARSIKSKLPELDTIQSDINHLRDLIEENRIFLEQDSGTKKKIRGRNLPIFANNTALSEKAGINPGFYDSVYKFLSGYSHAHPLSIDMLTWYEAGTEEGLNEINIVLTYANFFLCSAEQPHLSGPI